jgi:hypothetical protein
MRQQILVVTVAIALVLPLLIWTTSAPAGAVDSDNLLLPDLGMAELQNLQIQKTADGRKLLRFSSIVVNVGAGPFEAHGQRPDTGDDTMTTTQRIFDSAGLYLDRPTDAIMYYSGDGHDHWHLQDLEDFELVRLDNGRLVGTGAKHGFCFYDNYRYGSTQDPFYTRQTSPPACGQYGSELSVTMGLSVGWGDIYKYTLPDQYINVTGLASGRYRLWATADDNNWFLESDDTNNYTWVDIQLRSSSVKVVKYGPSA